MVPVKVDLPDVMAGDTWEGLTIGPVLFNDAQPAAALETCRLYFCNAKNRAFVCGFKSLPGDGFGEIVISDPATWELHIPAQLLPLTAGSFVWDFETTDALGIVRTLYNGILNVIQDNSHD